MAKVTKVKALSQTPGILFDMAEAGKTPSLILGSYDYDPSSLVPSQRDASNHVIEKGPYHYQPQSGHFPKDKNNRKFLTSWYERFKWIEYSKKTDKAYCFYCRL